MKLAFIAMTTAFLAAPVAFAHEASHPGKSKPLSVEETSFGRQGDPNKATKTIQVGMSDKMRFTPSELTVKRGETVRFQVRNAGKVMHEMVIGTMDELKKHAEMMKKHPGMEHEEAYMAHIRPGKSGSIVWQFTKAGEFHYACLLPGHFEAGMIGKITVTDTKPYAGEQERELKALSVEEVNQYLVGAGMGFAKSAELNHFPGPMHVLELADQLGLSAQQRAQTRQLMDAHKAEARVLGAKVVQSEQALEALFRTANIDQASLAQAARSAAEAQGAYRLTHLDTHRSMRSLLTAEQVASYDRLRGYGAAARTQQKHQH